MKLSELRQWRSVKDDEYLKVTRDHLQIAGWNKSAAVIYAVLEFRAHPGGKGDVDFMNIENAPDHKVNGRV